MALLCCQFLKQNTRRVIAPKTCPSPLFPLVTTLFSAVVLVYGIIEFTNEEIRNSGKYYTWNILACVIAILNILYSLYLYIRFVILRCRSKLESKDRWNIILYDVGTLLYILIFIFQIVWIVLGFLWSLEAKTKRIQILTIVNAVFLSIHAVVIVPLILLSLVTECFRHPSWEGHLKSLIPPEESDEPPVPLEAAPNPDPSWQEVPLGSKEDPARAGAPAAPPGGHEVPLQPVQYTQPSVDYSKQPLGTAAYAPTDNPPLLLDASATSVPDARRPDHASLAAPSTDGPPTEVPPPTGDWEPA